ncbi:hypothetical protein QSV34_08980 [Porticoccus sp. W117]|nr:hypothetical protein [Porticoccus sp. W117]
MILAKKFLIRKSRRRVEEINVLQKLITEGLESGDAGKLDMQTVKRKARAKVKANFKYES